ncbi:MAG: hypothetical protein V5A34_07055, partial [Halapricum sp.]
MTPSPGGKKRILPRRQIFPSRFAPADGLVRRSLLAEDPRFGHFRRVQHLVYLILVEIALF